MVIHIVRMNETIDEIIDNYHITLDDLKMENRHITDFLNIAPGTKLRITPITLETIQILDTSEPLVLNNQNDPKIFDEGTSEEDTKNLEKEEESIKKYKPGIRYVNPPRYNRYRR
ncbi:MAG: hypothetical protein ACI35W_06140 [Anaeroplasmataceae bacterium]